jgi:regulator of protease activity HflC (stomatin/prohibitin superfamily)
VVNWKLQANRIKEVYQTVQGNIADTIMYNAVIDTTKTELGKFRIGEIAQGREKLKSAIESNLKERLKSQFVDIVNVSVTNVDFSADYEKSVESKLIAEQQALEAKNKKESVRYQAEAKGIENQQLSATITPLVLKQKLIEKWDGHFPQIMGGNQAFLMDIAGIMGTKQQQD